MAIDDIVDTYRKELIFNELANFIKEGENADLRDLVKGAIVAGIAIYALKKILEYRAFKQVMEDKLSTPQVIPTVSPFSNQLPMPQPIPTIINPMPRFPF
ncbi:MAG: hypothetical protein ACP5JE_03250 [Thermoplasmata archaeon]